MSSLTLFSTAPLAAAASRRLTTPSLSGSNWPILRDFERHGRNVDMIHSPGNSDSLERESFIWTQIQLPQAFMLTFIAFYSQYWPFYSSSASLTSDVNIPTKETLYGVYFFHVFPPPPRLLSTKLVRHVKF